MSMSGGVSFYEKSKALFADGATAAASSANAFANLAIGTNKYFKWVSSGSDDLTTETYTITLPAAVAISRIFLVGHNFKQFQIKYGVGTDFTGVTGLDDYSGSSISETTFARDTAYYEFDEVTTDTIILTVDKTQTADAEKEIIQVIATNEIGTLEGFPTVNGVKLDRNTFKDKATSGRLHVQRGYENASFNMRLSTYPIQDDIDILDTLHAKNEPFLVWLNGGKPDQFRFTQRGWRLQDIYQMQIDDDANNGFAQNVYVMGVDQSYSFVEVV